MRLLKTSPIFFVDGVEPQMAHWRDRLGYEVVAEVPHGADIGFVILVRDASEIMLQTFASGEADLPAAMPALRKKGVAFYHEVDDLTAIERALAGATVLSGPRLTEYGMKELFILDAEGFVHGYAQRT